MKKFILLIALLLIPGFVAADTLFSSRWKVGTVGDCVQDLDVDVALATTVDQNSAAAAKVLYVANTGTLVAGDTVLIDKAGTGDGTEVCTVASISAGVSITCVDDLVYTHLLATADDVTLTNRIGPLNANSTYYIQLVSAAGAPQSGRWLLGDANVDAETNGGIYTASTLGQPGKLVRVPSSTPYVSFKTFTTSAIGQACQIR